MARTLWQAALAVWLLCPLSALAEGPPPAPLPVPQDLPGPDEAPLTAEEFDALTQGKTMDTYDPDQIYGVEQYLPGRRSVWKDSRGCMQGTWEQVGAMICFRYEDRPDEPDCWTYYDRDGVILGWYNGDRTARPILLYPSDGPLDCDYLGV